MRIASVRSHFNGLEFLRVRQKPIWYELRDAVGSVEQGEGWRDKVGAALTFAGWRLIVSEGKSAYMKTGVVFVAGAAAKPAALGEAFDVLVARYRRYEFDVCVLALESIARRGFASLSNAVDVLGRFGRGGYPVPLILLEIESNARPARIRGMTPVWPLESDSNANSANEATFR